MNRQNILDRNGWLLFYIKIKNNRINVYNRSNMLIGFCENGKTYDWRKRLVCYGENPGVVWANNKFKNFD